jgi:hypothetical protein
MGQTSYLNIVDDNTRRMGQTSYLNIVYGQFKTQLK